MGVVPPASFPPEAEAEAEAEADAVVPAVRGRASEGVLGGRAQGGGQLRARRHGRLLDEEAVPQRRLLRRHPEGLRRLLPPLQQPLLRPSPPRPLRQQAQPQNRQSRHPVVPITVAVPVAAVG